MAKPPEPTLFGKVMDLIVSAGLTWMCIYMLGKSPVFILLLVISLAMLGWSVIQVAEHGKRRRR